MKIIISPIVKPLSSPWCMWGTISLCIPPTHFTQHAGKPTVPHSWLGYAKRRNFFFILFCLLSMCPMQTCVAVDVTCWIALSVLASSTCTCRILFVFGTQVVTPQVDVSRHGAVNRGTKRARDARGYSTWQTPNPTPTPTNKSRRLSHVEITCRVGKQLPQVGPQPHLLWPCDNTSKPHFLAWVLSWSSETRASMDLSAYDKLRLSTIPGLWRWRYKTEWQQLMPLPNLLPLQLLLQAEVIMSWKYISIITIVIDSISIIIAINLIIIIHVVISV